MWSAAGDGSELRLLRHAVLGVAEAVAQPAAGVEAAARRRVGRRGDVALEHEPLLADPRVGVGHGRQEGDRVRVAGLGVELVDGGQLDQPAQVHHPDPVADVLDDREVVGDEQVGQAELLLEVVEQVQDLALDRHVERRDGLVADDELGVEGERPGDADALALAARELVRVAVDVALVEADLAEQLPDQRRRAWSCRCRPWTSGPSPTISPTVIRGLRLAYGSWKTTWRSRRTCFIRSPGRVALGAGLAGFLGRAGRRSACP